MAVLVDTNVLVFSIQIDHPWHKESIDAVKKIISTDEAAYVLPQNIAEFWNVCTRPAESNGLGLKPQEAAEQLATLESLLTVLHETPDVYTHWRRLVVEHEVRGVQVHDARLAAAMQVHGVKRILTYNSRDFGRYDGIAAIHPRDVK